MWLWEPHRLGHLKLEQAGAQRPLEWAAGQPLTGLAQVLGGPVLPWRGKGTNSVANLHAAKAACEKPRPDASSSSPTPGLRAACSGRPFHAEGEAGGKGADAA
ncbi:replication factor C subunit 3 [Platysternon megacephalum]|uniref:Replication factor C subunit 3 n=1 Tax=Platysternon megacephalum TaxID=55544 RepID=A0A4D9ELQ5_9SAUR|nr:replication factor C subunit 3 [Platysternon megacephalum]